MKRLIVNLTDKLNAQDHNLHEQNRTIVELTNKLSLVTGYEQIGVYGNYCTKKGSGTGTTRRCVKHIVGGITQCALKCTSYNWCIGFAFHFDGHCNLVQSRGTESCPTGYTFYAGPIITSKDEFARTTTNWSAQNQPSYVCFAKT